MASSIKELHCSDCLFFRHSIENSLLHKPRVLLTESSHINYPINQCSLNSISQYRKDKLAHGDDLIICDNGRTEMEHKLLSKGW